MLAARRMVIVLVAVWSSALAAGFLAKGLEFVGVQMSRPSVFILLGAFVAFGLFLGISEAKETGPWTVADIRDGAIGWGVIAGLLVAIPVLALVSTPWNVAVLTCALLAVAALAAVVRRNADRLGVRSEPASRVDRGARVVDRSA